MNFQVSTNKNQQLCFLCKKIKTDETNRLELSGQLPPSSKRPFLSTGPQLLLDV